MTRTVLITGAGSGIGRATALLLSKAGDLFKVVATDVNTENLSSLTEEMPDIRAEIAASENGLHVLINNAGIMPLGPAEMLPEEWHRKCFEVNYWGTVRCCKTALPYMRDSAAHIEPLRPRLVNISSIAGLVSFPFADAYNATKYAIEGLSEAMALTLPQTGVDVFLVEPGATETRITRTMELTAREILAGGTEEFNQQYANMLEVVWPRFTAATTTARGGQSAEEVAEVIKGVLTAEHPHLRNVTHKRNKRLVSAKMHDLNGDRTLAAIREFVEKNWHVSADFKVQHPPQLLQDDHASGGYD